MKLFCSPLVTLIILASIGGRGAAQDDKKPSADTKQLIDDLRSDDNFRIFAAIEAISQRAPNDVRIAEALASVLERDGRIPFACANSQLAAHALEGMGATAVRPVIKVVLRNMRQIDVDEQELTYDDTRSQFGERCALSEALMALGTIGVSAKDSDIPFRTLFKARARSVRRSAVFAFARIHHPSETSAKTLVKFLDDPVPLIRAEALRGLALQQEFAEPHLRIVVSMLDDDSAYPYWASSDRLHFDRMANAAIECLEELGYHAGPVLPALRARRDALPRSEQKQLRKLVGQIFRSLKQHKTRAAVKAESRTPAIESGSARTKRDEIRADNQ